MMYCHTYVLLLELFRCLGVATSVSCASPQNLEYGKTGAIMCSFEEGFYGVYWYNSTDLQQDDPIIYISKSVKGGKGYTTGEFDIYPNGSLLINNVTLQHDKVFTASFLQSQSDIQINMKVLAIVIVVPTPPVPVIQECEEDWTTPVCFLQVSRPLELVCSINNSRPSFGLNWMLPLEQGDKNETSNLWKLTTGTRYTTVATTNVLAHNSLRLHLLSCVADNLPGVLVRNKSYILVQNTAIDWTDFEKLPKVFERFSKMELTCTDDQVSFLVWKKDISTTTAKNILYTVVSENKLVTTIDVDYEFGWGNPLILPSINLNHQGLYACIYSNGINDGVTLYEVTVIVQPVPSYLVIEGCNKDQYCLLEVEHRFNLTCHIRGVFPEVQLKWTVYGFDENIIAFTSERVHTKERDDLFDVTITTTFEFKELPRDKMAAKCSAIGQNAKNLNFNRVIDLSFLKGLPNEIEERPGERKQSHSLWITLILSITAIVIIVIVLKGTKDILNGRKNRAGVLGGNENVQLNLSGNSEDPHLQGKISSFLNQLKEKYKDLYDGVPPVPYRKDEMMSVKNVFVDSIIESFHFKEKGQPGRKEWGRLGSYLELFVDQEKNWTRRILQGEPGYGKSILCLQVAYDWCNSNPQLKGVDLLILLKLKQIGGVRSIYTAIKSYILPMDTTLNENDIKIILKTFKSVLVILDGFDEYLDHDTGEESDFFSIISRQMFQECTVVITTRSSSIPTNYPPSTKIFRLRGFDKTSRLQYIQKLKTYDNVDENKIEQEIMKNPVLSDLSEMPMLFAIFVNLEQESNGISKVTSVTDVFECIISAFHEYTKNLTIQKNLAKYASFQKDHGALDKICFKAVAQEKQRIVWEKNELIQAIGSEFYKQYIKTGILVEEEVTVDNHEHCTSPDLKSKVEVSFVHKLFCEWYAAHYLRDYLKRHPEEILEGFLKNLYPSSLQHVYRFACGLDIDCAKRLIEYLPNREGGVSCAILCIQEQLNAIKNFSKTIEYIFSKGIIISGHDSIFLQRASIKLLKHARNKGMSIKSLCLYNCLDTVDISSMKTLSGMDLSPDIPVERLKLNVTNRDLSKKEAMNILELLTKFESLNYVMFGFCLPPWSIEDRCLLMKLQLSRIKVNWRLHFDSPFYTLNFKTGHWERDLGESEVEKVPIPLTDAAIQKIYEEHARAMTKETKKNAEMTWRIVERS